MAEIEHVVRTFTVDDNLQAEIEKLQADGFQTIPGIPPVIVYHLMRQKSQPVAASAGLGKLSIDDSKVMIIRDGKMVQ